MESKSLLIEKLKTLPKGYLSRKVINGREYFYLQYKENGKVISRYVPSYELNDIKNQLAEREKIVKEIGEYNSSSKVMHSPSKRAKELSGYLMMGDTIVGEFEKGNVVSLDEAKCPLILKRTQSVEAFLKSRSIDSTRVNSRILKKYLGIEPVDDDHVVSLYVHGATITDNYWFKPKGSVLRYKDVMFFSDIYNEIALDGEMVIFPSAPRLTPQLTLIGSYEKCWRKINDDWWIYKKENEDELFSELLASSIASLLKIPTVKYEYDNGYIRSKNFATKYNFEPMSYLMGSNEKYLDVFNELNNISKKIAKQYLKLLFFDVIVHNIDRHNENYGLLRDKETGKIVSLAPNFDNNLALLGFNKHLINQPSKDGFIAHFKRFVSQSKIVKDYYSKMSITHLEKKQIENVIDKIPIKKDKEQIASYIESRYQYLLSFIKKAG